MPSGSQLPYAAGSALTKRGLRRKIRRLRRRNQMGDGFIVVARFNRLRLSVARSACAVVIVRSRGRDLVRLSQLRPGPVWVDTGQRRIGEVTIWVDDHEIALSAHGRVSDGGVAFVLVG